MNLIEELLEEEKFKGIEDFEYNLDVFCEYCVNKNINLTVPWILSASYLYYYTKYSFISDGVYDKIYHMFCDNYENITHRYKHLIIPDKSTTSLFYLKESDYSNRTKSAAIRMAETIIPF